MFEMANMRPISRNCRYQPSERFVLLIREISRLDRYSTGQLFVRWNGDTLQY